MATFVAGQVLTAAEMEAILAGVCGRLHQANPQTLSLTGFTALTLGTQDFVSGGMTGTAGLTVPQTGIYRVSGLVSYSTPSATLGIVSIGIGVNGTNKTQGSAEIVANANGAGAACNISELLSLTAADVITLQGFVSTGTVAIQNTGAFGTNYLTAELVSGS